MQCAAEFIEAYAGLLTHRHARRGLESMAVDDLKAKAKAPRMPRVGKSSGNLLFKRGVPTAPPQPGKPLRMQVSAQTS